MGECEHRCKTFVKGEPWDFVICLNCGKTFNGF